MMLWGEREREEGVGALVMLCKERRVLVLRFYFVVGEVPCRGGGGRESLSLA